MKTTLSGKMRPLLSRQASLGLQLAGKMHELVVGQWRRCLIQRFFRDTTRVTRHYFGSENYPM
jgi:hypothetical protein